MKWLCKHALYLAWVVALSGLLISVYYGEVLGFEPCRLCWYQRIALFPLALFLGIAAYKNDRTIALYALPLVGLGGLAALAQIFFSCGQVGHCAPFASLPFLSISGFVCMALLILFAENHPKR